MITASQGKETRKSIFAVAKLLGLATKDSGESQPAAAAFLKEVHAVAKELAAAGTVDLELDAVAAEAARLRQLVPAGSLSSGSQPAEAAEGVVVGYHPVVISGGGTPIEGELVIKTAPEPLKQDNQGTRKMNIPALEDQARLKMTFKHDEGGLVPEAEDMSLPHSALFSESTNWGGCRSCRDGPCPCRPSPVHFGQRRSENAGGQASGG
jgi:hypothetical protein